MIKRILYILFCSASLVTFSQNRNISVLKPAKIGFLYNDGSNENFMFDDPDYTLSVNTLKGQLFYKIGNVKNINFELIVQPQVQFLKHQLINEFYVTPDQENFEEKIAEFAKTKTMNLYGLEFGFASKIKLTKKLDLQGTISLGFCYIDTRTERLAKGFTFI
jgi:hypothetical protein